MNAISIETIPSETTCWQAVLNRDTAFDGRFVYAVQSTGIYCRPSCPSRRPRRGQVQFEVLVRLVSGDGLGGDFDVNAVLLAQTGHYFEEMLSRLAVGLVVKASDFEHGGSPSIDEAFYTFSF